MLSIEALIIPELRPAIDIIDGKFSSTHQLWRHLSSDDRIRGRIEAAIPSVGRVELPGNRRYPYGGTGFVVGDGLLMTNRHVAEIFAAGFGAANSGLGPVIGQELISSANVVVHPAPLFLSREW